MNAAMRVRHSIAKPETPLLPHQRKRDFITAGLHLWMSDRHIRNHGYQIDIRYALTPLGLGHSLTNISSALSGFFILTGRPYCLYFHEFT